VRIITATKGSAAHAPGRAFLVVVFVVADVSRFRRIQTTEEINRQGGFSIMTIVIFFQI
jgi:hypothetical protein